MAPPWLSRGNPRPALMSTPPMHLESAVAELLDPPPSEMPSLTLPFAVVGAAAGWLSAGFIANPLINHLGESGMEGVAALSSAVICAAIGQILPRICTTKNPFSDNRGGWLRVGLTVLLGGSLSGGITAGVMLRSLQSIEEGLLLGLCCAAAFLPVCALVLLAARRAERARLGSIVADADRREVWGILVACLSVATLAALPDWLAATWGRVPVPLVAVAMALGTGLATAALLSADKRALERIARATEGFEASVKDGDELVASTSVPKVDLGLGDDLFAKLSRHAAAYRNSDRAVALVVGSPEQAEAAVRKAIRRGVMTLFLCGAVLAIHGATAALFR
jgi:hypothetical protein